MANFRSNHSKKGTGNKSGMSFIIKLMVYAIVLIALLWRLLNYFKKMEVSPSSILISSSDESRENSTTNSGTFKDDDKTLFIDFPSVSPGSTIVKHNHFTLAYSEPNEQAEWVAYTLTKDHLNMPKVARVDYFSPDNDVLTKSALHRDYTGSGYTRGHLAPAADMSFDQQAAIESFYMSNISPQEKYFNQGIWRELEENTRDWARKNKSLLIVTGPILKKDILKKIGDNRVSVPSLFYKILLDTVGLEKKGIAFVMPNRKSDLTIDNYMVTIDSVEVLSGIDFFNSNTKNINLEKLESIINKSAWPIDPVRYTKRVEEWNKK